MFRLGRPAGSIHRSSKRSTTFRYASTLSARSSPGLRGYILATSAVLTLSAGYLYITDTRASVHSWLAVPLLRHLVPDAEDAHEAGTQALKKLKPLNLNPRERVRDDSRLQDLSTEVFGHALLNPIGISAGLDKHAEIPSALFDLGPSIVEVGGVTPLPQAGNAKPRVFRIPSQNAIINRYGLNSKGADHVAGVLRQRVREFASQRGLGIGQIGEDMVLNGAAGVPPGSLVDGKLLAVQIAKNKDTPESDIDAVRRDYVSCASTVARYADIVVLNVSSPNTPGLRSLQAAEPLEKLLTGVVSAVKEIERRSKPAVMVKVSPDEDSDAEVQGICQAVLKSGVDGIIVGNTTKQRPAPLPAGIVLSQTEAKALIEQGGYSGPQLFERTVALVEKYKTTFEKAASGRTSPVIFATGGIVNGKQALEVLKAGASVAMVYTALTYGGVGTITRIKQQMRDELRKAPQGLASSTTSSPIETAAIQESVS